MKRRSGIGAVIAVWAVAAAHAVHGEPLPIDTSKVGQTFHGIGAISGGGGTSRLLVDYPEPQRSQILDYLFLPNYGASLHMLKVEIGGDSQSTDGSESSHMHTADTVDYHSGYEWWLLAQAKKRNPDIKTYGLPWAFPGWTGGPELSGDPYKHPELTTKYVTKWLEGARDVYNVEVDYVGLWNERGANADYVKLLRKTLDGSGFADTKIVANDLNEGICKDLVADKDYADAVGVIGLHYPDDRGDYSKCHEAGFGLSGRGGRPIWSSEESSSFDSTNGAACWARVIAAHWVLQNFTSSMMWNLIASYFHGTNWQGSSLLTAQQPWTGHYGSMSPVWATAHITQFTRPGWDIIELGSGSGKLPGGGFYVTYSDPKDGNWTLTVVKISHDHAACTRPILAPYAVTAENVTFQLVGDMPKDGPLAVWYSNFEEFSPDGQVSSVFQRLPDIVPRGGAFTVEVKVGAYFTISTVKDTPRRGEPATPIPAWNSSLPLPYEENFDNCAISQSGAWLSDQIGIFEVHFEAGETRGNRVLRQMVSELPIGWSDPGTRGPVSLVGMREWQDISISAKFRLPVADQPFGACLCSRCSQMWTEGIVLCMYSNSTFTLSLGGPKLDGSVDHIYATGIATPGLAPGKFAQLSLLTVGDRATGTLNGESLFSVSVRDLDTGFAAIGASTWAAVEFDDIKIESQGPHWQRSTPPVSQPKPGDGLFVAACARNVIHPDQSFEVQPNWAIRHVASGLCAAAGDGSLKLARCDPSAIDQRFKHDYTRLRDTLTEMRVTRDSKVYLLAGSTGNETHGSGVYLKPDGLGDEIGEDEWVSWTFFPNTGELRNQYVADVRLGYPLCLSVSRIDPDAQYFDAIV